MWAVVCLVCSTCAALWSLWSSLPAPLAYPTAPSTFVALYHAATAASRLLLTAAVAGAVFAPLKRDRVLLLLTCALVVCSSFHFSQQAEDAKVSFSRAGGSAYHSSPAALLLLNACLATINCCVSHIFFTVLRGSPRVPSYAVQNGVVNALWWCGCYGES